MTFEELEIERFTILIETFCSEMIKSVEQGRYGHYARKPTMLLVYGVDDLPSLEWGIGEPRLDPAVVERMGLKRAKRLGEVGARGGGQNSTPRIHTPEPFRELLIVIARSAKRHSLAA